MRAHLLPHLARNRLAKLTPQDVATCLHRVEESKGAFSARSAREILRTALNQALRWELVSRNVAALTDAPRHRPRQIKPLTPEQANALLAAVAGHRLGALITVAVGVGLRQGEALGLRWEDVDSRLGRAVGAADTRARRHGAAVRGTEDDAQPSHDQPARRCDRGLAPPPHKPA